MNNEYDDLWQAMKETKYVNTLKELQDKIDNAQEIDSVLSIMLEIVAKAVRAEVGTLWYYDSTDTGYIYARATYGGSNLENTKLLIGDGVAGNVIKNNQPYIIDDCEKTLLWNRQVDNTTGFKTKSMICVPLTVEGTNKPFAAIQIINRIDGGYFDNKDMEFANELAKKVVILFLNKADEQTLNIITHKKIKLGLDDAINQLSEKECEELLMKNIENTMMEIDSEEIIRHFLEFYRVLHKNKK